MPIKCENMLDFIPLMDKYWISTIQSIDPVCDFHFKVFADVICLSISFDPLN